ncbi:hypothetical protein ACFL57_00375 [Candidatus Margulisiibacteriota bacterium]
MKKAILICLILLTTVLAWAGYVGGYYRSNGTYVQSRYKHTIRDNYLYYKNYNPQTGAYGAKYYRKNSIGKYYTSYGDN